MLELLPSWNRTIALGVHMMRPDEHRQEKNCDLRKENTLRRRPPISTFRSVKITEATDKRPLPFNHRISYEITNRSDQQKTLRLVTSRDMGNEHRSVYHFKEPPDATPENTLVWMLKLEPAAPVLWSTTSTPTSGM